MHAGGWKILKPELLPPSLIILDVKNRTVISSWLYHFGIHISDIETANPWIKIILPEAKVRFWNCRNKNSVTVRSICLVNSIINASFRCEKLESELKRNYNFADEERMNTCYERRICTTFRTIEDSSCPQRVTRILVHSWNDKKRKRKEKERFEGIINVVNQLSAVQWWR